MTRKLDILFLCGWYPSRVLTNNGDFIQRHAEAVQLLHNVTVLHIISDINCTENIEHTFEIVNNVNTYIAYIKPTNNSFLKSIRYYNAFQQILKKIGAFDIVHLHEIFPFGLFSFLIRKPLLISEHWTGYHHPQVKKISFGQLFISRLIAKRAKFICPVSMELQNSMEAIRIKGNYKIIHNTVDTAKFHPSEKNKDTTFTILHISNMLDEHKNVSGIINTVSKLTIDYQLILIGENSSKYKSLSDEKGIANNVTYIEHLPHHKIADFLRQASLYISFSNYETWGIVMAEALACGTPVISTDTGVLHELNLTSFASIIKKNDEEALLNAILKHSELKHQNNSEMYNFVKENFSPNQVAKELSDLYLNALT